MEDLSENVVEEEESEENECAEGKGLLGEGILERPVQDEDCTPGGSARRAGDSCPPVKNAWNMPFCGDSRVECEE